MPSHRAAILHGAGFVGGELARLLSSHEAVQLAVATSRTLAGRPLWEAHPGLRGVVDLTFSEPADLDASDLDVVFVCAEHGRGAPAVAELRDAGYTGLVVDLSADHRLADPRAYRSANGIDHPAPGQLAGAVYGLPEVNGHALPGAALVANPGCFATGISLALWPLAGAIGSFDAHVTALTGASGSGTQPSAATHFATRHGNIRAYRPLTHRHVAEVEEVLGIGARVHFVPASGPWTRGIWGTAHVALPAGASGDDVADWYDAAFSECPLVRLSPGALPELLPTVGTPFCDIGWVVADGLIVVGFALDNLLKGAAGQAVQNMNLALGLPETVGLLPAAGRRATAAAYLAS